MDYIGSKARLVDWILSSVEEDLGLGPHRFLDGCAGSGVVTVAAANRGWSVLSNDVLQFSGVIVRGRTSVRDPQRVFEYVDVVNALPSVKGYFTQFYSPDGGRMYLTQGNAEKVDSVLGWLSRCVDTEVGDYIRYCLLEAMSRVLNTTGVQAAYLKKFTAKSLKPLVLRKEPTLYVPNVCTLVGSVADAVRHPMDVVYIDPPYTSRQYGPNYHLYETAARGDCPPLMGKTGLRPWTTESRSSFCSRAGAESSLSEILFQSRSPHIYLSYSTDGLLQENEILQMAATSGWGCSVRRKAQRRYKSDVSSSRKYNENQLFELLFHFQRCR